MKNNISYIKKQSVFLIVISFLVIGVFVSYALISYDLVLFGERNNEIYTCSLDMNVKDTDPITLLNAMPINDQDIVNYEPYKLTIKNNDGGCPNIGYIVTMGDFCSVCEQVDGICAVGSNSCNCNSNYKIPSSFIKYQIVNTKTGNIILGTDPFTGFKIEDRIETTNDEVTYEIKMWISNDVANTDLYVADTYGAYLEDASGAYITKSFCSRLKLNVVAGSEAGPLDIEPVNIGFDLYPTIQGNTIGKANFSDDSGVVAWAFTRSDELPTSWNELSESYSTTQDLVVNEAGVYYVWAKDTWGNVSNKSFTVNLGEWTDYVNTVCDTSNSFTCESISGYKKEVRTVASSGNCNGYSCDWRCDTASPGGYYTYSNCTCAGVSLAGCTNGGWMAGSQTCRYNVDTYLPQCCTSRTWHATCPSGYNYVGGICENCYYHSTCYHTCINSWSAVTTTYTTGSCSNVNTTGYYSNDWTTRCTATTLYRSRSVTATINE